MQYNHNSYILSSSTVSQTRLCWTSLTVGTNMWRWSVWMDLLQTQSWGFTDFFLQWAFNNLSGVCHIFISSTVCVSCSVFVSGIVTFKENQNISGFQLLGGGVGASKKLCVWIKCRVTGSWFRALPHLVLHADWMKKNPPRAAGREGEQHLHGFYFKLFDSSNLHGNNKIIHVSCFF